MQDNVIIQIEVPVWFEHTGYDYQVFYDVQRDRFMERFRQGNEYLEKITTAYEIENRGHLSRGADYLMEQRQKYMQHDDHIDASLYSSLYGNTTKSKVLLLL